MKFVGRFLQDFWKRGSRRIYKITVPEDTNATRHLREFDTWLFLNGPMHYGMLEPMFLPPLNLGPAVFRKLQHKGIPAKRLLKYVKCAPNSEKGRNFLENFLRQCILVGDTHTSEEVIGFLERDEDYILSTSLVHMVLELPQKTPDRDKVLSRWWFNFEQLGVAFDLRSYEMRFEALLEDGRSDKILPLLQQLQSRGHSPNAKIWGIIFDSGVLGAKETLLKLEELAALQDTGVHIYVHALQAIERHFVMTSRKEAQAFLKDYIELLLRKFEFRIQMSAFDQSTITSSLERAFLKRDMHIVNGPNFPVSSRQQFVTRYPHSHCLLNQLEYFFSEEDQWEYGDEKQIRWQIRSAKSSLDLQNVFLRFQRGFQAHEATLFFMKLISLPDAERGPLMDAVLKMVTENTKRADNEQITALTNLLLSRQKAVSKFQLHDLIRRILSRIESLFEEAGLSLNDSHSKSIFPPEFLTKVLKLQRYFALSSPKVLSRIAWQFHFFARNDELDQLKPNELALCMDTLAVFDFQHYPMCNTLTSYLQSRIKDFKVDDLAVLARSFASMGFSSNSIWPLINNRINDFNLSKEKFPQFVTLAWSLSMMDYFPLYTFLTPLFELWRAEILTDIRSQESDIGFEEAVDAVLSPQTQLELWELSVNYQAKGHDQFLDDDLFQHFFLQYGNLRTDHAHLCSRSPPHQQVSQILQRWGVEHVVGETVSEGFYVDVFVPKANTVIEIPSQYTFSRNHAQVLHRGRRVQIERLLKFCGYKHCKISSQSGWKRLSQDGREALLENVLREHGCQYLLNEVRSAERKIVFS